MAHEIEAKPYAQDRNEKGMFTEMEQAESNAIGKADFRADAIEAENVEHAMTVMEAVKAYPMACFWAFVMSSTIVSGPVPRLDLVFR